MTLGVNWMVTLTFDAGVNVILSEDPEGIDGDDPAVPIERNIGGSLDPFINTTNTMALMNVLRQATAMTLVAMIGSRAAPVDVGAIPSWREAMRGREWCWARRRLGHLARCCSYPQRPALALHVAKQCVGGDAAGASRQNLELR